MKAFRKLLCECEDDFCRYGIEDGDIGFHLVWKGSSSFASAGSTMSLPIVPICLRAMLV